MKRTGGNIFGGKNFVFRSLLRLWALGPLSQQPNFVSFRAAFSCSISVRRLFFVGILQEFCLVEKVNSASSLNSALPPGWQGDVYFYFFPPPTFLLLGPVVTFECDREGVDKALPCSKAVSSSFSSTLATLVGGGNERGSISSSVKMKRESMDATIKRERETYKRKEKAKSD